MDRPEPAAPSDEGARQSDFELRRLLDALPVGAYTCDAEGLITYYNAAAVELWGRAPTLGDPRERYCGSARLFATDGSPIDHAVCWMALALRDRREYCGYEIVVETPTGERRTALAHATPLYSAAGTLVGGVNVLVDISDRKRAEAIQAQLAAIVASSDDAIVSKSLDGRILSWNVGAERLYGYSSAEAIGRPVTMIIPPDRRAEEETTLAQLLRGERIEHYETVRVTKGGRRIDVSLTSSPVRDGSGRVVAISKVARDIGDRKRAEVVQAQIAAIVESSDDAIVSKSLDGYIQSWNLGAERLYGYTAAEAVGKPVTLIIPPDRLGEEKTTHERLMRGERVEHYETVRLARSGERIDVSVTSSTVRDGSGRIVAISKVARDIRQRKRAEEESARLYAQVLDADRTKNAFLATLAHELRNPLAPVRNAIAILRAKATQPELAWAIDIVDRQTRHMKRLIDDLLDISRITGDKLKLALEWLDLRATVDMGIEASMPLIEAKGHVLVVDGPHAPLRVRGDPARLAQVISNLLGNAAKYTEPGGRIELSVRSDATRVEIEVRDSGIGIPREMLHRVFEMFAQIDHSLDRSEGGLGIGLALVQRLVAMHGGHVTADSPGLGQGSVFTVYLPIQPDSPVDDVEGIQPDYAIDDDDASRSPGVCSVRE